MRCWYKILLAIKMALHVLDGKLRAPSKIKVVDVLAIRANIIKVLTLELSISFIYLLEV